MKKLLLLILVATTASRAWGYALLTTDDNNFPIKWHGSTITMQIKVDNLITFADGNTRATSIQKAMTDPARGWNQYLGSIQFSSVIMPAGDGTDGDSANQIFFSASAYTYGWDSNTLAITTAWISDDQRGEADIIFNTAFTWDSYRGPLKSNGADDIQRVALHELGHVLGLDHPDEHGQSVVAVMNSIESNVDSLEPDDIAGAQSLYGAPGIHPANDNFANAITLANSASPVAVTGLSANATKQSGEPNHGNDTGGHSVWWKWTAPAAGSVTLDTSGSNFDTLLGVYTGASVSALTTVASNDDVEDGVIRYSSVSFTVSSGITYYFAVDGWDGDTGAIDLNLNFSVPTAPSITSQPGAASVTAGANATFSATASGSPAPIYQWQRLPAGSGTWANLADSASYSGSALSSLTVTGVISTMNGDQFRVIATNSLGGATSNPATLSVSAAPNAISYDSTNFPAAAIAGTVLNFTYSVTNQGSKTWGANHYVVLRDSNGNNLSFFSSNGVAPGGSIVAALQLSVPPDTGSHTYQVQGLENNVEWFSTFATLVLNVLPSTDTAPSVQTQPAPQVAGHSGTATFALAVSGTPAPTYQWQREAAGTESWINVTNSGSYQGSTTGTLTIAAVVHGMNGDQFRCVVTNEAGSVTTNPALLTVPGPLSQDLNSDGWPDLLWENTAGIDRAIWYMNGTSIAGFDYLAGIDAEWKIVGTADFDGDGQTDVAWEDVTTGDRTCWFMNGKTIASFGYFALVDTAWHVAAIGDFDGDGKPDLIWENNTTGDRAVWFLDGENIKSFGYIAGIDPVWHIVGAADFDGDGQTDLVWENPTTGDRTIWYMNGATLSSFGYIANVPAPWHIAMVADMDGDGHPDLVWENRTTGDRAIWLMNNVTQLSAPYLAYVDPAWHIAP